MFCACCGTWGHTVAGGGGGEWVWPPGTGHGGHGETQEPPKAHRFGLAGLEGKLSYRAHAALCVSTPYAVADPEKMKAGFHNAGD